MRLDRTYLHHSCKDTVVCVHATNSWESGGTAPLILNLGARWR